MLIHPFRWRDLGLIRRLETVGVPLDSQVDPRGGRPLRAAIAGSLPLTRAQTFVLNSDSHGPADEGFLQIEPHPSRLEGQLLYLSPSLGASGEAARIWLRLLTHACAMMGQRGYVRFYASLEENPDEAPEIFRQAGFAGYSRDRVFERFGLGPVPDKPRGTRLRRQRRADHPAIWRLFEEVTPKPVQQAEVLPLLRGRRPLPYPLRDGFVVDGQGGVVAHARLCRMGRVLSARLLVTSAVEGAPRTAVQLLLRRAARWHLEGLRILVPEYQSGLRPELEEQSFQPTGSWLHLVKQTAVPMWEPVRVSQRLEDMKPTPTRSRS